MKYKCLVLDHDETVVQTEKTIGYPFFCNVLQQLRPGMTISLPDYVQDCHALGFADLCRQRFQFTDEELNAEHLAWTEHIRTHIPDIFPGIEHVICRQKAAGGLLCVVSHSTEEIIRRDYHTHFSIQPDAVYGWDLPSEKRKPNPYPLLEIMKQYDLSPEEILVVDDVRLGWQMAQSADVDIAFAAWSKEEFPNLNMEMRKLCKYTFDSTKALENFLFD